MGEALRGEVALITGAGRGIGRGALSGRFIGIDDDLDALAERADDITARELFTLRIQA